MLLEDFKHHCINGKADEVVQKFLIEDSAYFFNCIQVGDEFDFKKNIAKTLGVHIRDIAIVGSGKLGFSLKPDNTTSLYKFKKFDHEVKSQISSKKSDLDIAVVSSQLFDKEMENLYNHTNFYKRKDWGEKTNFAKFMLKGRFPIRLLPLDFSLTEGVRTVQNTYRMKYDRIINVEIYKSWYFFETYHRENIKNIQVNLIA